MLSLTSEDMTAFAYADPDAVRAKSEKALNLWVGVTSPLWAPFFATTAFGVGLWSLSQGWKRWSDASTALPNVFDSLMSSAATPQVTSTDVAGTVQNMVDDGIIAPIQAAGNAVKAAGDAVTPQAARVAEALETASDTATQKIPEAVNTATDTVATAAKTATDTAEKTADTTVKAAEDTVKTTADTAKSVADTTAHAAKAATHTTKTAVADATDEMTSAAVDTVNKTALASKSATAAAADTAVAAADSTAAATPRKPKK